MKVKGKKAAVYYSNRAFVHIKLENYAIAIMGESPSYTRRDPLSLRRY